MKPSKVIILSAITTVAGTVLLRKVNVRVPGFTR